MKKFVDVYIWQVLEKIREGKKVYFIDKEDLEIKVANNLRIETWIAILKENEKEENFGRFSFYYIEEEKENENGNI